MAENNKNNPNSADNEVRYFSDIEMIELTEENTEPTTTDESHRRRVAEKYGRKEPPAATEPPPAR